MQYYDKCRHHTVNLLPSVKNAELLVMLCILLAVQVYDWLKYDAVRLVSISVDVVEVPVVLLIAVILSFTSLLHVMEGAGSPMAVQLNVTLPPRNTTAS